MDKFLNVDEIRENLVENEKQKKLIKKGKNLKPKEELKNYQKVSQQHEAEERDPKTLSDKEIKQITEQIKNEIKKEEKNKKKNKKKIKFESESESEKESYQESESDKDENEQQSNVDSESDEENDEKKNTEEINNFSEKKNIKFQLKSGYEQNVYHPDNPIPTPTLEFLEQDELAKMYLEIPAPTVVCYGARGTGKSWIIRNLLFLSREKYPFGIVFSSTAFNGFWDNHIPGWYIYPKYYPGLVANILRRQSKLINAINQHPELEKEVNPNIFVLLDDIIHDPKLRHDETLKILFTAGRHFRITVLIASQYAKGINPTLRGNTDLAFILKQFQKPQEEALWEEYGSSISKKDFMKMLDLNTKDKKTILINNREENKIIKDRFKQMKAVNPGDFIVGCKAFWIPPDDDSVNNGQNYFQYSIWKDDYLNSINF